MGFYSGFSTVLMFSMPANAVYFTSYSVAKRELETAREAHDLPISDSVLFLVAGFTAQICASVVFTPFDVAKQRLQVSDSRSNNLNGFGMINKIAAQDGWLGLYRGLVAGWAVWCPFSAIYFCTYETVR